MTLCTLSYVGIWIYCTLKSTQPKLADQHKVFLPGVRHQYQLIASMRKLLLVLLTFDPAHELLDCHVSLCSNFLECSHFTQAN